MNQTIDQNKQVHGTPVSFLLLLSELTSTEPQARKLNYAKQLPPQHAT